MVKSSKHDFWSQPWNQPSEKDGKPGWTISFPRFPKQPSAPTEQTAEGESVNFEEADPILQTSQDQDQDTEPKNN